MFIVCNIFNKITGNQYKGLTISHLMKSFNVSGDFVSCNFSDIGCFCVSIFDDKDYSIESYLLIDLLKIIQSYSIEINGIWYEFYRSRCTNLIDLNSIKKLEVSIMIANPSKELMIELSRNRILNKNYITPLRELINLDDSFIKGDTLYIPNSIVSIKVSKVNLGYSFSKIFVPKSVDLTINDNRNAIGDLLLQFCSANGTIILDDDSLVITPGVIASFYFNNIHVNGKIKVKNLRTLFSYEYDDCFNKIILSDNNRRIIMDFNCNKIINEIVEVFR